MTPGEAATVLERLRAELQHDRAAYQQAGPEVAERHDFTLEALRTAVEVLSAAQQAENAK